MSEKELKMFDVDAQLDAAFGKEGTPERKAAEDRANAFFTGQLIEEARKKANMTQAELEAKKQKEQMPKKISDRIPWAKEQSEEYNAQIKKNKAKYRGMEL